ncbi:type IV secretory system conjugative DNA transfer family protein [Streptomyces sp. NBRC 110465]|uniref:type IV secretory system conjugative DNA transfer family protein n=1 Tax=Streptomyces sp. NBRC 110465 TaxID=1897621 RepID=UPI0009355CA0|nr:type IV secretory system conjugative DNA transfer family protein [Streptomyces sp. NBRC 110465]
MTDVPSLFGGDGLMQYGPWALLGVAAPVAAMVLKPWERQGDGATWGGRRVEKHLRAEQELATRTDRLIAGRGTVTKKLVAGEPCLSGLAFGVPGSGKSMGLLLPNALEWAGPLVITTVKASDLDMIYARRAALGPVYVVAPKGIPGRATARWSPVEYCKTEEDADQMAKWLAEASSNSSDPKAQTWLEQAQPIIKGLLLAARVSGEGITAFRRWLSLGKDAADTVEGILLDAGFTEAAEDYASPWRRLHADGQGSVQLTLNVIARVYQDKAVRETSSGSDFTAEEVLAKGGTIAIVASASDSKRFAPLITALIASVIHAAETQYGRTGKPLSPALGLLIDEAGNVLRYPDLATVLTTGRGQGIVMFTIWHDLSQLRTSLGDDKANTVFSASPLRMLLPGVADPETLKYFNTMLGRAEVKRATVTRGSDGGHSSTTSTSERDLAPIHELQQLEDGTAVVQYGNQKPVRVRLRMTFKDEDLQRLINEPTAQKELARA